MRWDGKYFSVLKMLSLQWQDAQAFYPVGVPRSGGSSEENLWKLSGFSGHSDHSEAARIFEKVRWISRRWGKPTKFIKASYLKKSEK